MAATSQAAGELVRDWDQNPNATDWRREAKCLGSNPELFFPLGITGQPLAQAQAAKRICQACAVRHPCLQFALETNQDTGVWGGTTEDERRTMRRNWLRSGSPSPRGASH